MVYLCRAARLPERVPLLTLTAEVYRAAGMADSAQHDTAGAMKQSARHRGAEGRAEGRGGRGWGAHPDRSVDAPLKVIRSEVLGMTFSVSAGDVTADEPLDTA
jgi:hypothetical protein